LPRRLRASALAVALFAGCAAHATGPTRGAHDATVHHAFDDVAHWVKVFDDPARDAWQKPAEVVRALGIGPGMCVADLGAGTGYFTRYLAEAAGDTGTVLAIEVEPNLVAHLRARAERERLATVVPILASADNPRIPRGRADLVLIVDTIHHIDDRLNYFRRLHAALAPGGRVAVIDFKPEPLPVGPPPAHKLPRAQIVDELAQAGYRLVAEPSLLPYQYFLIFQPVP
jgi:predicted methyltransferase